MIVAGPTAAQPTYGTGCCAPAAKLSAPLHVFEIPPGGGTTTTVSGRPANRAQMTMRWSVLLLCLLLLPAAAAAGVRAVPPPFSAMPAAQAAPAGQSGEAETDEVEPGTARSVAVVRFANISRDAADDWIGDGIAETVAADLESLGTMVVIGREAVASVLGDGAPASRDATAVARWGRDVGRSGRRGHHRSRSLRTALSASPETQRWPADDDFHQTTRRPTAGTSGRL